MLVNPIKGEREFTVGEDVYTLAYSIPIICGVERQLGRGIFRIVQDLSTDPWLGTLCELFLAGLKKHHPKMTLEQAGGIVVAMKMVPAVELLAGVITDVFPAPEPADEEEGAADGDPRPPKASRGTGKVTSSAGVN